MPATRTSGWRARLSLCYEHDASQQRTVLARRAHEGPLCVQRPFYPDADGTCHTYLLHPPGGVAGSDSLELAVSLGEGSRVLLTTPAATKLYRALDIGATIDQRLTVAAGALLRWLPQETIAFDGSRARMRTRIDLAPGAHALAWEVLCLGRPVSGQRFEHGALSTALEIFRQGRPWLIERSRFDPTSASLTAAYGMRGMPVLGTLVCTAGDESWVDGLREVTAPYSRCVSVTRVRELLICRYLGARVEDAQHAFRAALSWLSLRMLGAPVDEPRIWRT